MGTAERILEDGNRAHDNLRVVCGCLVAGRTIVVPLGNLVDGVDDTLEGAALGAKSDATAIDPDVLGDGDVLDLLPALADIDVLVVEGKVLLIHFGELLFDYLLAALHSFYITFCKLSVGKYAKLGRVKSTLNF